VSQPTLDDVAAAAGVARSTASRALSGAGPASAGAQARVRAAAAALGFTPNPAARTLATRRSYAVALVIPEPNVLVLGDPFLTGMIIGTSEAFRATDYQVLLVIVRPDDEPGKALRVMHPSHVDGAIMVSHHGSGAFERVIRQSPVPKVYVGRPWPDPTNLYVDVNNRLVGDLATRRLVERGARRIACIAGPADMAAVHDRTAGWRETLQDAGLPPGPVTHSPFTLAGGATAMTELLPYRPDAVFVQSDLMAAGAIKTLEEHGIDVGRTVRIVGVDDSDFARSASPPLTSVTNPAANLSARAARMLLRLLDDNETANDVRPEIVDPVLVIRDSG
jgi:DNA-binding LacI/PurR family transcriptional regulator